MNVAPTVDQFLQERPTATLGTVRRDGSPQASVVWYLWDGSTFLISTVPTTAKWHNLRRDPRCSLCIEEPESGQMVVVYGRARLDDGDVRARTRDLVAKYYDNAVDTDAHMDRIFQSNDRVLIEVIPDRMIPRRLEG